MGHQLFRRRSLGHGAGLAILLAGIAAWPALAATHAARHIDVHGAGALAAVSLLAGHELVRARSRPERQQLQRRRLGAQRRSKDRPDRARERHDRVGARPAERLAGREPDDLPHVRLSDRPHDGPQPQRLKRRQRDVLGVLRRHELRAHAATDRNVQDHRQPRCQRQTGCSSAPVDLQPSAVPGWQPMRIVLTPSGAKKSEFQIYNLYVDPRMRG